MKVECWQDEAAFDRLAERWNALHERSATATLFNSLVYARLWWRHFGDPGALRLWTVWDGESLVGIAPLYQELNEVDGPVFRLIGGVDVSDYLDVLAAPGLETDIVATLLAGWADVPCQSLFDFHAIPHASPTREAFLRLSSQASFAVETEQEEVCPVISLPETWDEYLEGLDGKQRRELRRKLRKAGQEALVTWYRVRPDALNEEMEHFFSLHASSDADKAAFMTDSMRAFFLDLARTFSELGWLDLCFLLVNGERAAAYMNFTYRNEVLVYNSGFKDEMGQGISPGWLLLCYHIEDAIRAGRSRYDFLRGNEEYKFRFGARSEPVYQLRLTRLVESCAVG